MDLVKVSDKEEFLNHNDERRSAETSVDHSLFLSSSSTDDIFGDPDIHPRLGDEYQVPIPSLILKTELFQLQHTPNNNADINFNFCPGEVLSIPIMWNHHVIGHFEHANREPLDSFHGYNPRGSTCKVKISEDQQNHGYISLPGSPVTSWSGDESESFLLGLYIFGKNLVQVQRFVESKKMGNVLSFYYGEFYRSDAHCRWVDCRKMRSRRCILGHRIFTGWRQQEILSRLLPSRSKEVQETLVEATKIFNEGSASLEDFVFTLKAIVGTKALVKAIGIGKGKQDLTGIILDSIKTNSSATVRPEIPVGKACSSLTSGEIIKFLTGDFRLSKAKSNDLFWEAVWPRLLARGWHSEQPKDVSSFTSKNSLVFLIPGIKKFSRKKLTKGNHYFDSVSDVLNKVASDPMLLELEVEDAKESSRIDDCHVVGNGLSNHQRPCYLRPRNDTNSDLMKFTIVDTSLAQGGMPSKMRELRSLPDDASSKYRRFNHSGETNSESSTEQSSSSGPANTSLNGEEESYQSQYDDQKPRYSSRGNISTKGIQPIPSDPLVTDSSQSLPINGHLQFNCRVKSEEQNSLPPVPKRQKLAPCKSTKVVRRSYLVPRDYELKKEDEHVQQESVETSNAIEEVERPQQRTLIDLNLQPLDLDIDEPSGMEVEDEVKKDKQHLHESQSFENDVNNVSGEQLVMNGRRQSTRSRPPTTKALEALACGFLSVKKGRSTKTARPSRSSRRTHKLSEVSLPASDTDLSTSHITVAPSVGMGEFASVEMDDYFQTTGRTSFFDNSHAQSERTETHGLFGVL